jgi:hypothetical protein
MTYIVLGRILNRSSWGDIARKIDEINQIMIMREKRRLPFYIQHVFSYSF